MQGAAQFAETVQMPIVIDREYQMRSFLKKALPAEDTRGGRCRMCYTWRLQETADYAAQNGFDAFTSTLFYSIYQQHDLMRSVAEYFADQYGITFYYEDFRIGWQEGIDMSKAMELYRQSYCGCIFSEEERYSKELQKIRRKENREKKRQRQMLSV